MTVYFISGLGADERVFQKLKLPSIWKIIHIKWPDISKNETLVSYSTKISKSFDASEEFAIIGVSFGGIVAIELTKILNPKLTIIISSISSRNELPEMYKLIGYLKINKIVPSFLLNRFYPFTSWYFGVKSIEEKLLLKQIVHDTSPIFLSWAINEILNWRNKNKPENIYHIHGNNDKIFPAIKTKADLKINGGHFMVYNKANEISKILIEKLATA